MIRKNVVLPFRFIRAGSDAVNAGTWYQETGHSSETRWLVNGSPLEDWSYDTPLTIGREIKFNSDLLLEELCLLDAEPSFELLHTVKISNLGVRRTLHRETIDLSCDHTSLFNATLDSSGLCEELSLASTLVLRDSLSGVPDWSPSKHGSICWEDETRIVLEGSGSRFPMQELSFSKDHRLPDGATWHLEWRPGLLHYSFNSAVTLLLNSERAEFFERVQEGDEVVIEQVMSSITVDICSCLLGVDDFINAEIDYPDGSLGSVARTWLLQALPGKSLGDIQSSYERSPSIVHTALRGLAARI